MLFLDAIQSYGASASTPSDPSCHSGFPSSGNETTLEASPSLNKPDTFNAKPFQLKKHVDNTSTSQEPSSNKVHGKLASKKRVSKMTSSSSNGQGNKEKISSGKKTSSNTLSKEGS